MPRRNQFTEIAGGLVSRFVSRNNDVDGFWGIGVLSQAVHDAGRTEWNFDLLGEEDPFDHGSRAWLMKRLESTNVPESWLESATLRVTFIPHARDPKDVWWWEPWSSGDRVPAYRVTATATLRDDWGRAWEATAQSWCRDHNPGPERRSLRDPVPPAASQLGSGKS